jgi:LAO/AO transport system kinase
MKKGILELADLLIVNKADGDLKIAASRLKKILELSFSTHKEEKDVKVLSCSSLDGTGIDEIWKHIESFVKEQKEKKLFFQKRAKQNLFWFDEELLSQLKEELESNPKIEKILSRYRKELSTNNEVLFASSIQKAIKDLLRESLLS